MWPGSVVDTTRTTVTDRAETVAGTALLLLAVALLIAQIT